MKQKGLTLLELLVGMVVLVIVITQAVPGLAELIARNRRVTAVNEFVTAFHLAKSTAVKSVRRITLCKSADGARCEESGGWEQGWIVFEDDDANAQRADAERLLLTRKAIAGGITIRGNTPYRRYLSFVADGTVRYVTGGRQIGTMIICSAGDFTQSRALIVSWGGRLRLQTGAQSSVSSCLDEDPD
ncbi:GspH/FimT family pseudopilin [Sedimenticola sp.]|uniref:GspH/FimT family pseudopilin n=1 Tax=Sedimenticola sp. TaxID=1940285 RepID=UPI003D0EBB05